MTPRLLKWLSPLGALFGRDPVLPEREDYVVHAFSPRAASQSTPLRGTRCCDTQMLISKIIYEEIYLSPWQEADFWVRCRSMRIARLVMEHLGEDALLAEDSGQDRLPVELLRFD